MPTIVNQAKVQAMYHNGVLALRLPKHAATIPKRIAITS
jgi:HSP20 family molecular chaperone IbpA